MPQTQSRHDLNKLSPNKPSYFILFVLSLVFIVSGVFIYNYVSKNLSRKLTDQNIQKIYPTSTQIPTSAVNSSPSPIPTDTGSSPSAKPSSPTTVELSPTPSTPYLKTFSSSDLNFKIDYLSTRQLFQDDSSVASRFVFVHPDGNFVVHVGFNDYTWTHSGRVFSDELILVDKQTFVFDTTSQKVVDLKTDDGYYYTLQCVHNGKQDLIDECQDFINSFSFLD